ncbi:hypothetical protein A4G20_10225 [Pasteurellaceae bacterium RH1A]|nr:hypothetical protein A4G20_10225 [Pasteurellaceae bacterium RH1A]
MEYAISLTNYRQKAWVNKSLGLLIKLGLFVLLLILVILFLLNLNQAKKAKLNKLKQDNHAQENKLISLKQQVESLKQSLMANPHQALDRHKVMAFLAYLSQVPLKGGLESLHIVDDQLKISGKLSITAFDGLEDNLKAQGFAYKVVHFQLIQQGQVEFSLQVEEGAE